MSSNKVPSFLLFLLLTLALCFQSFASTEISEEVILDFLKVPLPEKFKNSDFGHGGGKYWLHSPSEFVPHPKMGYIHRPNSEIRHIERLENEILYDVTYSFDQYSRRVIPYPQEEKRDKFLMLFGCSFTYGNGLNDQETLGNYLAAFGNYYVYNYAIGGSGPHMLLSLLRERKLNKEMEAANGTLVYVYHSLHPRRTIGTAMNMTWLKDTPYFEKQDGRLIRKGTLASSRPLRTKFLSAIKYLNEVGVLNRDFPSASRFDLSYVADILQESKKEFRSQFPEGKFIVYVHPLSSIDEKLKDYLNKREIQVLEGRKYDDKDPRYIISPHDRHPSAKMNEELAKEILKALKQ